MMKSRAAGFSMIELMITLVIVAIVTGFAYPSYKESIAKGRRSDAQTALAGYAAAMERTFVANNNNYATTANCTSSCTPMSGIFPTTVPTDGGNPVTYNLTVTGLTSNGYTLKAVRSTTGPQKNDKCGDFTLNQFGQQGIENAASGITAADCWRK